MLCELSGDVDGCCGIEGCDHHSFRFHRLRGTVQDGSLCFCVSQFRVLCVAPSLLEEK